MWLGPFQRGRLQRLLVAARDSTGCKISWVALRPYLESLSCDIDNDFQHSQSAEASEPSPHQLLPSGGYTQICPRAFEPNISALELYGLPRSIEAKTPAATFVKVQKFLDELKEMFVGGADSTLSQSLPAQNSTLTQDDAVLYRWSDGNFFISRARLRVMVANNLSC